MKNIIYSLNKLDEYIINEQYKGYDLYDTLLSPIPFQKFGKWLPIIAIQLQKRNPVNIRPLLGIKKDFNPKGMGLLLNSYSILYRKTKNTKYLNKAKYIFEWLSNNYSRGYSGHCWGYNFPWASPKKVVPSFSPSSVVTGFVCNGIFEYYKTNKSNKAKDILISASDFVLKDLNRFEDNTGLCFSYTPMDNDICYNANLLAGEIIGINYYITKNIKYKNIVQKVLDFVVARQHDDGKWNYSYDSKLKIERSQIDFHQGFVLCSIDNILKNTGITGDKYKNAILQGLEYYFKNQFFLSGQSKWRLPKVWPTEIHNQAQGILTFSQFSDIDKDYYLFAQKIAKWTIDNMQGKDGHFFNRKYKYYKNKISYMRWSQAWMMLGFAKLFEYHDKNNKFF